MIGYTGWAIPEGVVTQIAKDGVVLWKLETSKPIILEVEKITSDTYAGETTYTGEEFILLDIYPKTNGTVNVTYGGLTKTITDTSGAENPNAQQVFFGTFNGVSDSVATPASGELVIEGDYENFGISIYNKGKITTGSCSCITKLLSWGTLTTIYDDAFYGCTGLTSIAIQNGITSIGGNAFRGCTSLEKVTIPSSVTSIGDYAFYGCTGLTSITIPNGVTSIGVRAFCRCTSLEKVTIPSSVTSIESLAFSECTSLKNFTVANENMNYCCENGGLYNKSKTYLHTWFESLNTSTSITIPSSVTSIGDDAFYGCTGLTSITIPSSVTSIGDYAFYGCTGLTSITIPSSIKSISNGAFDGCTSLEKVTIPSSVTSIGAYAFEGCTGLTSITIPNGVTSIGGNAFNNCTGLTSITIPNGVTSIGLRAFNGCTGLTTVTFNNTVGWFVTTEKDATSGTDVDVTDTANNVTLLTDTYKTYYWYRAA